ncbi:Elongation factor Ts, mitochondrial [Coemansia sp. RSA 552]|nr:Elongation factor Ts, mitochondrial [Coemansia sp. RSA 552]
MWPQGVCTALRSSGRMAWRTYATAAKVDIGALKRVRQLNPVPISKAKEALLSTDNSVERALEWLEKDALVSGAHKAEKVKDRVAAEGAVSVHTNSTLTAAAIVELGCETDFVARNSTFVDLAARIARLGADTVAGSKALAGIEPSELEAKALDNRSVADTITEAIGRLGENIVLRRTAAVGVSGAIDSVVTGGYVHGSVPSSDGSGSAGKIGGVVALRSAIHSDEHRQTLHRLAKRLSQQVVGYAPRFVRREEWENAVASNAEEAGDPEATVLEAQQFLFGGGSVAEVLAKHAADLGAPIEIASFVRFERGEGVAKQDKPSFAEEIQKQLS